MNSSETPPQPHPPADESPPYTIFDKRQKWFIIIIASTAATFSGFAGNIYFPALPTIANDLDVSPELVNLTVTTYLIFQALAPSLWGPISDAKGRRVAFFCTFLVFLAACIALAEAKNYVTLLVIRCLQSTGSASTIAIGAGVIGDITTRADRGGFMGAFQTGLLVPVAVGPVIGGALAGSSWGWKSIFWFLAIYCGVFLIFLALLLPETLRSIVGNGSKSPSELSVVAKFPLNIYQRTTKIPWQRSSQDTEDDKTKKSINILSPLRILLTKHAAPIIFFCAVYYTVWQMTITTLSTLFTETYSLSATQVGLTFIANGFGSMIGTLTTGKLLDMDYARIKASHDDPGTFPLEKARLRLIPIFSLVQCASIVVFGWTIQHKIHIAVPIVTTFITGWTAVGMQGLITTYLVDIFPDKSAAATASMNLARCLCGAGGISFVMPLVNEIGVGWTFAVCAGVQIVALAGAGVQYKFAGEWRREAERKALEGEKSMEERETR
ncbi:MFS antiporter QDR2 [Podospora fimiseda]|uniref:MFS antiporter QDR2 n=1 Tax=Podospora fimiseda TaxID=252190 RepID=A0AAN7BKY3_9PEZI|nr:MFS antiporter QDR2 [Podospora fimiseda]